MESHPPTVRVARARLAALRRWRSDDALRQAKCDLVLAHAAALTAEGTAFCAGGSVMTTPEPYRMQIGECAGRA